MRQVITGTCLPNDRCPLVQNLDIEVAEAHRMSDLLIAATVIVDQGARPVLYPHHDGHHEVQPEIEVGVEKAGRTEPATMAGPLPHPIDPQGAPRLVVVGNIAFSSALG